MRAGNTIAEIRCHICNTIIIVEVAWPYDSAGEEYICGRCHECRENERALNGWYDDE